MSLLQTACDIITEYVHENGISEKIWTRREIIDLVKAKCPDIEADVDGMLPSDICYNRCNGYVMTKDFASWPHALFYVGKGEYQLLGSNYPFTGRVIWNKEKVNYIVFGEWFNGKFTEYPGKEKITKDEYLRAEEAFISETDKTIERSEEIGIDRVALAKLRGNQGTFRNKLLHRYSGCVLCKVSEHSILVASHIKPWCDCKPEEKIDVNNGFLLCPNHDKLFDQGYISFDDSGQILISSSLTEHDRILMNVREGDKITLCEENKQYLQYHRNVILKK